MLILPLGSRADLNRLIPALGRWIEAENRRERRRATRHRDLIRRRWLGWRS